MRDDTWLRAFELANEVAVLIYRATRGFHKQERAETEEALAALFPSTHSD